MLAFSLKAVLTFLLIALDMYKFSAGRPPCWGNGVRLAGADKREQIDGR